MLKHQKNCNVQQGSSGCKIGQKRPLTSENPQMVINKKIKLSNDGFEIETVKTAFKSAAITWRIKYREHEETDIINLLQSSIFAVKSNLIKYRGLKNALKFNMALHAVSEKAVDPAVKTFLSVCLVSEPFEVYDDTNVKICLNDVYRPTT